MYLSIYASYVSILFFQVRIVPTNLSTRERTEVLFPFANDNPCLQTTRSPSALLSASAAGKSAVRGLNEVRKDDVREARSIIPYFVVDPDDL